MTPARIEEVKAIWNAIQQGHPIDITAWFSLHNALPEALLEIERLRIAHAGCDAREADATARAEDAEAEVDRLNTAAERCDFVEWYPGESSEGTVGGQGCMLCPDHEGFSHATANTVPRLEAALAQMKARLTEIADGVCDLNEPCCCMETRGEARLALAVEAGEPWAVEAIKARGAT